MHFQYSTNQKAGIWHGAGKIKVLSDAAVGPPEIDKVQTVPNNQPFSGGVSSALCAVNGPCDASERHANALRLRYLVPSAFRDLYFIIGDLDSFRQFPLSAVANEKFSQRHVTTTGRL